MRYIEAKKRVEEYKYLNGCKIKDNIGKIQTVSHVGIYPAVGDYLIIERGAHLDIDWENCQDEKLKNS